MTSARTFGLNTVALSSRYAAAFAVAAVAGILAFPTTARAQEKKDCEPGSWFCGETQPPGNGNLQPLPDANGNGKANGNANGGSGNAGADKTPPPVVVYQPPPPTVVVQAREAPPPYYYVPRTPPPKREWGLNLHVGGAMMGDGRDNNAGMGLGGIGFRFRPIPQAALQADLDFGFGRDYNGYRRNETAFTLNGLIFLNPKNKTQVYLLGGFGWSGARAIDDRAGYDRVEYHYGYFGVQGGVGLEFRLAKAFALNVDVRGLVRGRIDESRHEHPEFVSSDGRSTNASGAGLVTGGLTFYW